MTNIYVSSAASLFKENGHDLKGLYQLVLNAVSADQFNGMSTLMPSIGDCSPYAAHTMPYSSVEYTSSAKTEIRNALNEFTPDAEWGEKRILKFHEDNRRLKELSEKIKPYGFWAALFRVNKQLRLYLEEKRQIESMKIELVDLLQVAFYKFTQIRGTKKQFVEGFERYLQS